MVLFVLWLLHAARESWRHAATHPHIAETARGLHTHPRLSSQLRPFSFFELALDSAQIPCLVLLSSRDRHLETSSHLLPAHVFGWPDCENDV